MTDGVGCNDVSKPVSPWSKIKKFKKGSDPITLTAGTLDNVTFVRKETDTLTGYFAG